MFFFSKLFVFLFFVFFFPGRVYSGLTNSLPNSCFFFGPRKKKTGFLLTDSDFHKKCTKLNYSAEKKKYGTFVYTYIKKNCLDKYLVGLYFGQVGELPQRFSKSQSHADFFKNRSKCRLLKKIQWISL